MVELISGLQAPVVAANLDRIAAEIHDARIHAPQAPPGLHRGGVEILAATKYVAAEELPVLAEAGVRLVGENRAQDLERKHALHGGLFEWDFIGALQSRKVRVIAPLVRPLASGAGESALRALERALDTARPGPRILIEVNVSGERSKAGVAPEQLDALIARSPVEVAGLMTMPPFSADPEASRPHFAALRALADERGLEQLSMGTSQDYLVAVEEGATIVRIGTGLYRAARADAADTNG